jgi:uncharacterized surface protein with fasciclin (FAS1) repeats
MFVLAIFCFVALADQTVFQTILDLSPKLTEIFPPQILEEAETSMKHWKNFTLFLPDESAIESWLTAYYASGKVSSGDFLLQLLHYHILPTAVFTKDLEPLQFVNTSMNCSEYVNRSPPNKQILGISKNSWGRIRLHTGLKMWPKYSSVVTQRDIKCEDGVIHLINRVLNFPDYVSTLLVDTWSTSLHSALISTGLLSAIDSTADITLFIPNNGALEAILAHGKESEKALKNLLLNHVSNCFITSLDLAHMEYVTMLSGKKIPITHVAPNQFQIGGANITNVDVLSRNGAVHYIQGLIASHDIDKDMTCLQSFPLQSLHSSCIDLNVPLTNEATWPPPGIQSMSASN